MVKASQRASLNSDDQTSLTLSGTMSASSPSSWVDLVDGMFYASIHAVTESAATWEIGDSGKSIIKKLVLSSHVTDPSNTDAGIILEEAIPGGGASIRLNNTGGSTNQYEIFLKVY